ncbi:MAG: hypothetical protein H5T78_11510 [Nocardia sp.]|nr:hypothetical protein [Nocardia sp.]
MIPSRPRLASWNLGNLLETKKNVWQSGQDVEMAVHMLRADCNNLPDLRAWSGASHDAAAAMLARTAQQAAFFGDVADSTMAVIDTYYNSMASARGRIDTLVSTIDSGPLNVSEKWVVLLDPEPMDAERLKVLRVAQSAFQEQLNPLVTELGQIDDAAVAALRVINYRYSDVRLDPDDATVFPRPDDGVPDPQHELGQKMQQDLRDQDAAVTVAGVVEESKDGTTVKTVSMQDGSTQVITASSNYQAPPGTLYPTSFGPPAGYQGDNMQRVDKYDANGNLVSSVQTIRSNHLKGATWTSIDIPGQTKIDTKTDSFGNTTGTVWDADGKMATIPSDSPFFTHPTVTSIGAAVTGLETAAGKGALNMALDPSTIDGVKTGSKFAGPGIGIATTIWDMAAAKTPQEACVAGVGGTIGTIGSTGMGMAMGTVGGPAAPVSAMVGAAGGSWVFGYLGTKLGPAVC